MTTSIESGTHPSLAAERFSHLSMSPDDAAADGAAGSSRNSFSGSPHGVLRSPRRLRILIVRHGETDCNVQGIIQGQLETDLNAVGREQARRVAKTLAAEHIDEVYASPLRRAHDTADAIVAAHPRFQAFAAAQAAEASAAATIEAEADAAAGVLAPASSPNSITSRTQRNRDSFQSSYSSAASPQRQNASSFSSISMAGGSRGGPTYWLDDRLKERAFGVLEGQQLDRSKPRRDSTQGIEQMTDFAARLAAFLSDVLLRPAPWTTDDDTSQRDMPSEWVDEKGITRPAPPLRRPSQTTAQDDSSSSPQPGPPLQLHRGGCVRTVVLVAHGAAISALVGSVLMDTGLAGLGAGVSRTRVWNCSITEVVVDVSSNGGLPEMMAKDGRRRADLEALALASKSGERRRFVIERWADVRHLPEELDDAAAAKGSADEMVARQAS